MKKYNYRIPVFWTEYGHVWVEAESREKAIEYALGPECPLPEGTYVGDSIQLDGEIAIETDNPNGVGVTKDELRSLLMGGRTLDSIFAFGPGQECEIFKAPEFYPGDEIIYIPDIALNEIPIDKNIRADIEGIFDILGMCYTGNDFIEEAGGDLNIAEELFNFCDWQHPSSAMTDMETWDDE